MVEPTPEQGVRPTLERMPVVIWVKNTASLWSLP